MKRMTTWLLLICWYNVQAQQTAGAYKIEPLQIGDQCPDFKFENIINYRTPSAKLSDFRGKLVILDFWATWCSPCLAAMPKLDSLQKEFPDKLVVLPVTYEERSKVENAIKEKDVFKNIDLPTVTGDTLLSKYFRRRFIPHEVWINEEGKVIATTEPKAITREALREYFDTKKLNIEIKTDILDYDMDKALYYGAFGSYKPEIKNLRYSFNIIQGLIKGWGAAWQLASTKPNVPGNDNLTRMLAANVSFHRIYSLAFIGPTNGGPVWDVPGIELMHFNRLYWEPKDSSLLELKLTSYKGDRQSAPDSIKCFTVEMIAPLRDSSLIRDRYLRQINQYFGENFGIIGKLEKKKMKYWALVRTTNQDLLRSKKTSSKPELAIDEDADTVYCANVPIRGFLDYWQMMFISRNGTPIIDETNYTGLIELRFDADPKNLESMNKGLNKFGLALKLKEGDIDMIVIKDYNRSQ